MSFIDKTIDLPQRKRILRRRQRRLRIVSSTMNQNQVIDREQFLKNNKLANLLPVFVNQDITIEELLEFSAADLISFSQDIGLNTIQKNRLVKAIGKLKASNHQNNIINTVNKDAINVHYNIVNTQITFQSSTLQSKDTLSGRSHGVGKYKAKRNCIAVMPVLQHDQERYIYNYGNYSIAKAIKYDTQPNIINPINNNISFTHILVIYCNTSVCLKFVDNTCNYFNKNPDLPIIINNNLQKLKESFESLAILLPNELIIVISQYLFKKKEIRYNINNNNCKLTLFDKVNNYGEIFATYCLNGKYGHKLIKKYENILKNIKKICNNYSHSISIAKFKIFDDYIYSEIIKKCSTTGSNNGILLCRDHYCINKQQ